MEDQGKRLLLTVALVAVVYVVWWQFFSPKPAPSAPTQPVAQQPVAPPASAPATAPTAVGSSDTATPTPAACDPAKETTPAHWETAEFSATFSRCGGALASFLLKGEQYRVHGKQIDLVLTGADAAYFPLQVQINAAQPGPSASTEKRFPVIPEKAEWTLLAATENEISYQWLSVGGDLQVIKTFRRIEKSPFAIALDFEVKNTSSRPGEKRLLEPVVEIFGYQNPNSPDRSMFRYAEPKWGTACYVDGSLKVDTDKELASETHARTGLVHWTGLEHQYFLVAVAPLEKEATTLTCSRSAVPGTGVLRTELIYSVPATLDAGQSVKSSVVAYVGPKLIDQLERVATVLGHEVKLADAVDLGWFAIIARPLLSLLKLFHGWVGNWGVAIILLTILVKFSTLYWTTKSMRSARAMAKLKPELDKIKAKYPDDKQRQQQEMLNFYKANKISPFGGCLPMLLQMPIWFALYKTLSSAAEIYHAPFFGWLQDLTAPDPYYVLPIALTALMFVQTRITPAAVDSEQQKIMQWMMPIMFGFFALLFPAGNGIYMFTNTLIGLAHQYYMNHSEPPKKAVVVPDSVDEGPAVKNRQAKNRKHPA